MYKKRKEISTILIYCRLYVVLSNPGINNIAKDLEILVKPTLNIPIKRKNNRIHAISKGKERIGLTNQTWYIPKEGILINIPY